MLESFDDAKPSGFMGFDHVPKQAYDLHAHPKILSYLLIPNE